MRRGGVVEDRGDRKALAADAGFGSLSVLSILAGILTAYGAFVLLLGIAVAIVDAVGIDTDLVTTDYEQLGVVGGLVVAALLLASYLFGGYVAGRMARRSGGLNGLAVAVLGLVMAAAVAALVRWSTDTESIVTGLRSLGVPTTADEYGQAFTVAGLASLAAVLVGGFLGGGLGERWHGKLLARAVDPTVGTEAVARQQAQAEMARAEQERTNSFERARTANPLRSRRVDRDALAQSGEGVDLDADVAYADVADVDVADDRRRPTALTSETHTTDVPPDAPDPKSRRRGRQLRPRARATPRSAR